MLDFPMFMQGKIFKDVEVKVESTFSFMFTHITMQKQFYLMM